MQLWENLRFSRRLYGITILIWPQTPTPTHVASRLALASNVGGRFTSAATGSTCSPWPLPCRPAPTKNLPFSLSSCQREIRPCTNPARSLTENSRPRRQFFSAMMALDTLDNLFTSGMTAKSKSTLAFVKLRSSNIAVSTTSNNVLRSWKSTLTKWVLNAKFIEDWPTLLHRMEPLCRQQNSNVSRGILQINMQTVI